jgi:hypothetical protein
MIGAFIEGLCGIEDQHKLFEVVKLSPRWAVTSVQHASVDFSYGASDASIGYDWQLRQDGCNLTIRAKRTRVNLHLLLPAGKQAIKVIVADHPANFTPSVVESSQYVDAEVEVDGELKLNVYWH